MWTCRDPGAKRAFFLHYQGPAVAIGLAASLLSFTVTLVKVLVATAGQIHAVHSQIWWYLAATAYMPLLYVLLGRERYILNSGANIFWMQLLFAGSWLKSTCAGDCAQYCTFFWRHRLVLIHAAAVLQRVPCSWYWPGGLCSWLVAATVDVADPDGACSVSLSCLLAWMAKADTPAALVQAVLQAALNISREAAVDIVLPGLLLTWLELRARRAWLLLQQREQAAATTAASTNLAAAATATTVNCKTCRRQHPCESGHAQQQAGPVKAAVQGQEQASCANVAATARQNAKTTKAVEAVQQQDKSTNPAVVSQQQVEFTKSAVKAQHHAESTNPTVTASQQLGSTNAAVTAPQEHKSRNTAVPAQQKSGKAAAVPAQQPAQSAPAVDTTQQQSEASQVDMDTDGSFDGAVSIVDAPSLTESTAADSGASNEAQQLPASIKPEAAAASVTASTTDNMNGTAQAVSGLSTDNMNGTAQAVSGLSTSSCEDMQQSTCSSAAAESIVESQHTATSSSGPSVAESSSAKQLLRPGAVESAAPLAATPLVSNAHAECVQRGSKPAAPAVALQQHLAPKAAGVASSSTEQIDSAASAVAAMMPTAAARDVHAATTAALQLQRSKASALYRSPLKHVTVSYKFKDHPGKGLAAIKRFQLQLAAAVEQAALAAATGQPPQATYSTISAPAVAAWVTSTAAFPGCFQVVLQLSMQISHLLSDTELEEQRLLQGLQHAAQQMADAWPDCQGLVDVQVQECLEQQEPPISTGVTDLAASLLGTPGMDWIPQSVVPPAVVVAQEATAVAGSQLAAAEGLAPAAATPAAAAAAAGGVSFKAMQRHSTASYGPLRGMYLQPVALATPCTDMCTGEAAAEASASLLSSVSSLSVQLCLPAKVVCQLTASGKHGVRVVVASQYPAGELLYDNTCQIQTSHDSYEAPGSPSVDYLQQDAPSNAPAEAATVKLHLAFPRASAATSSASYSAEQARQQQQQQQQVLTVVVLAGALTEDAHAVTTAGSAVAAAPGGGVTAATRHSTGGGSGIAEVAALHGVLVALPLLVLPASAAAELQQLFDKTAAADSACEAAAYAQLLPLLRDFGVALCMAASSSSSSSSSDDVTSAVRAGQPGVPAVLLNSLSAFFAEHNMHACEALLQTGCSMDMLHTADAMLSRHTSSCSGSSASNYWEGSVLEADGGSGTAAGNSSSSKTTVGKKGSSDSSSHGKAGDQQITSSSSSTDSNGSSSSIQVEDHVFETANHDSCKGSGHGLASAAAASRPFVLPQQELLLPLGSVHFGFRTVLLGFSTADAEAAYLTYKGAALQLLDFVLMISTFVAMLPPFVHLVALLGRGFTSADDYVIEVILVCILRTLAFGVTSAAHAVVWVAETGVGGLSWLRNWRSAVLYAGITILLCLTAFCRWYGGVLAKASAVVAHGFCCTRWPIPLHRDLMYLMFVCAEVLPYTVIYIALQFFMFDPAIARPAVLGLGAAHSASLLISAHLALSIAVEANMRWRFVRHVQARQA